MVPDLQIDDYKRAYSGRAGEVLYWFEDIRNSKLVILPEAGHLAWSDQPEMFASMVTDWVNSDHYMV